MPAFYEFFAGGGMVRAGLGRRWRCDFANDFDAKKALTYQANWGASGELHVGDVNEVTTKMLPGHADLIWGSSPCQDLSLAGNGAGLAGQRSGAFFGFWRVIGDLCKEGRAPRIVVIENVVGALSSHGGRDFAAMVGAFSDQGYRVGALVINAEQFVPQSRPRLFVVGIHEDQAIPQALCSPEPVLPYHTAGVVKAVGQLSADIMERYLWWNIPAPPLRNTAFIDVIEDAPEDVAWHDAAETTHLLSLMSPVNLAKVETARQAGHRTVGGVYRRTRRTADGGRAQRAEVRFDDVAGCLRTPSGGSSRQTILVVDGDQTRSRLISSRETARLMGLPDGYKLPKRYNDAYHLTGDGVVVPVVRHLAHHLFEPLLGITTKEASRDVA